MYICRKTIYDETGRPKNIFGMLFFVLVFFLLLSTTGNTEQAGYNVFSRCMPSQTERTAQVSVNWSDAAALTQPSSASRILTENFRAALFPQGHPISCSGELDVQRDWPLPVSALTGNRVFFPEAIKENTLLAGKSLRAAKTGEKRLHTQSHAHYGARPEHAVLPRYSLHPSLAALAEVPRCLLPSARGLVVFSLPPPHSC